MKPDLAESNDQLIAAWSYFARRVKGGAVEELGGVTAAFCRIPIPFFNIVFLVQPVLDAGELERRVHSGCEWAGRQNVPWLFCVGERAAGGEAARALPGVMDRAGLVHVMPLTGMIADELAAPTTAPSFSRRTAQRRRTSGSKTSLPDTSAIKDDTNSTASKPCGW